MKILLAIGTGSFIGGIFRYLIAQAIQQKFFSTFPFGTLTVNVLGCLLIGLIFGLSDRGNMNQEWRLFLATGICGGFTTFSSFSNETISMLRDGQIGYASAYIFFSVLVGLAATLLGIAIIKFL